MIRLGGKRCLFVGLALLMLLLAGCSGEPYLSTLTPQGENGEMLLDLMLLTTALMSLVTIVVVIIFIYVSTKFRRTKAKENLIPKQVEGNHKLEITWTVIPIIILLIVAVPTVSATFKLDVNQEKIPEDAIQINVTGKLYWWEFEYPNEQIVTSQDLVIPTGERIYLKLKAGDVKHAFWIPALAGKIDTNTDNENYMWIHAYKEGVYYGKCAELCGPSHALMDFKVKAVSKEEYEKWIANMQKPTEEPTDAVAKAGQEIFAKSCVGCHAVDSNDPRPEAARIAPNLSNFADRERVAGIKDLTPENVKAWLTDPEAMKPGNKMTGTYNLSAEEIDAVTAYLLTLSKENQ
ncbi:cytochrome c oxidase subunit II [Calidifontibacillus erzurumensis]|uniref:Cytochrome c oxidase subunit 2 n=1 Tax=Calidifontibacillus erzurumensis TaxID=2741433 RepID=A0A8J8GC85_9BACI|nr:cytochrome c oxidase subunit II [Calidifontibacillus erzurumensis]NSL50742.1 cytochrome c oxidase subunit II [Calidifontibacillus erzurumensis]